jgi:hypothetical protein
LGGALSQGATSRNRKCPICFEDRLSADSIPAFVEIAGVRQLEAPSVARVGFIDRSI